MADQENEDLEAFFVQFIRALNSCEPELRQYTDVNFAGKHIFPDKGLA